MPHSASARKRHRQNLRNRERNRAVKSSLKTAVRRLLDSLSQNDSEAVKERFRLVVKQTDRAAAGGTIHRNRAARIKSRLSARVKSAGTATAAG
ncbi:MAG: 30S ribosomal protein S20 [Planctomycetia bacterium]|jgi:small subunit ribosomal protein S20|nr:30S ribosomal protein S20 [Planctomycetia bacterium]